MEHSAKIDLVSVSLDVWSIMARAWLQEHNFVFVFVSVFDQEPPNLPQCNAHLVSFPVRWFLYCPYWLSLLIIVPVFYQQRETGYSRTMHHMCSRTMACLQIYLWNGHQVTLHALRASINWGTTAPPPGYAYHLWTVLTWRAAQYRSCSPTIEPRGFSLVLWRGQQNVIVCFEMDIFDTLSSFWIQVQLYLPWIFEARSSRGVGVG